MKTFLLKIVSVVELLFTAVLAASILWPANISLGACPEQPSDNGICDTMYVETYPPDLQFTGSGHLVRVPIFITHDVPNEMIDSIVGMLIPLCYTHTNPTKYCSLSAYWNRLDLSGPFLSRSIFRDLDDTTHNRFPDLYFGCPQEWFMLNVGTGEQYFWFLWSASQCPQKWGDDSRVLALTMTFRVEDTMTVCLDSCFWPPSDQLAFARSDAVTYIPRHNLPYCFSILPVRGDVTADGRIELGDLVYLVSYLYRGGPAPNPLWLGDVTCNGIVDLGDVVFLTNHLYRGGSTPSC